MGTTKGASSDYYLFSVDFEKPTEFGWSKKIVCASGTDCSSLPSYSIVSNDKDYIYSLTAYDSNLFYYTLEVDTGSPKHAGTHFRSGYSEGWKVQDTGSFVIVVFEQENDSKKIEYYISYINPLTGQVLKEFK
jgi:hypothetical protein